MDLLKVTFDDNELLPIGTDSVSNHGGSVAEMQLFVALSEAGLAGADGPKTMRFDGVIHDLPLLILVDSGSSHSFLSTHIAGKLQGVQ